MMNVLLAIVALILLGAFWPIIAIGARIVAVIGLWAVLAGLCILTVVLAWFTGEYVLQYVGQQGGAAQQALPAVSAPTTAPAQIGSGAPAPTASTPPPGIPLLASASPSTTSQPNPTPNSTALEDTLIRLRALQQAQPPRTLPSPQQGGGNPQGNDTAALSADQRGAIGDHIRACWTYEPGALRLAKPQVLLTVTTDTAGVARLAVVADSDEARLSDPVFRAFTERALRAVLDARCANLPLPPTMLGRPNVLTFRFSP